MALGGGARRQEFLQELGREVRAVRPRDRAHLRVHAHLREDRCVPQRLEHLALQLRCEIDLALGAVAEAEPEGRVSTDTAARSPAQPERDAERPRASAVIQPRREAERRDAVGTSPIIVRRSLNLRDAHMSGPVAA